jgi:hypothetical protein
MSYRRQRTPKLLDLNQLKTSLPHPGTFRRMCQEAVVPDSTNVPRDLEMHLRLRNTTYRIEAELVEPSFTQLRWRC